MADGKRKAIFCKIAEELKKLDCVQKNSVFFGSFLPNDAPRPILSIIPQKEDKERISKTGVLGRLLFCVRIICDKDDGFAGGAGSQAAGFALEDIQDEVAAVMDIDRTWGGLTMDTIPQSDEWKYLDQTYPEAGVDKWYVVVYQLPISGTGKET